MRNGRRTKAEQTRVAVEESGRVEIGSGNVFADLGFPNPELALAKARLVQRIRHLIDERKLTQAEAGKILGIDQPKVSELVRGKVSGYSLDRLLRFLNALGQRVEISIANGSGGDEYLVVVD